MGVQENLIKKINQLAHLCCIFSFIETFGIPTGVMSLVYNLRVSQTSQLITEEFKDPFSLGFTSFEEARWERLDEDQTMNDRSNALGELATFIYMKKPLSGRSWYVRADFAVARVSERDEGKRFVRTQTDDLFLAGGYSWLAHSNVRFTVSGILSIPTHKDTSLDRVQFGLGHLGLGMQFDGAFNYYPKKKCSVRMVARLIGTIPRLSTSNGRLLNYNVGEIIDLFICHHLSSGHHCFEFGYNPTYVVASGLSPNVPKLETELNLIRNSYYVAYEYNFEIKHVNNSIEWGLSFSSDIKPRVTGQKLIVLGWLNWEVGF